MKKKLFWAMGIALLSVAMLGACNDKQGGKEKADNEEELDDEDMDMDEDDMALFDDEETGATDNEGLDDGEFVVPDDDDVWKALGGTYPFADSEGTMVILQATPLDGDTPTLTIGDVTYEASIDSETGCITATDDDGNTVFTGYAVNGGNTLTGVYMGKPVVYDGMGGL